MNVDNVSFNAEAVVPASAEVQVVVTSERGQRIANLEARIAGQNLRIQNLEASVAEKDLRIRNLEALIASVNQRIDEKVQMLRGEILIVQSQID
ncbi:MAG: hypothetical protein K2L13_03830 [Opitutales bacterium]|nr:hypothetical protein [Opitutales bacterium]